MRGRSPLGLEELGERLVDDMRKTRDATVLDHFSKKEGEQILPDEIRERPIRTETIKEFVEKVLPAPPKTNPFSRLG